MQVLRQRTQVRKSIAGIAGVSTSSKADTIASAMIQALSRVKGGGSYFIGLLDHLVFDPLFLQHVHRDWYILTTAIIDLYSIPS